MPRPRQFVADEVLDRAMEAFWAKGFEATTLDDLEAATGLRRGSLYGAFGCKRTLFLKAIERYLARAVERNVALLDPTAGKAAITAFFRSAIDDALADRQHRGCMLTNCAVELAAHDDEVAARVGHHLDRLEHAFIRAIESAQARREIAQAQNPVRLARLLVTSLQGLQVLARARPDAAWLDDVVEALAGSV